MARLADYRVRVGSVTRINMQLANHAKKNQYYNLVCLISNAIFIDIFKRVEIKNLVFVRPLGPNIKQKYHYYLTKVTLYVKNYLAKVTKIWD
jgi:hypothetical protein